MLTLTKPAACLLIAVALVADTGAAAAPSAIDRLFDQDQKKVARGVHVVRLSDGKTLYDRDASKLLSPASVTKVITTAAALYKFTPAHTFKTKFFHTGNRKNEKILGDLIVVGDGDPFVISEKLWQLAADLRNMGIRDIAGELVIDNGLFAGDGRDESRQAGSKASRNAYDAPVSAFGVNFNTYAVAVAPGPDIGRPAAVSFDPYPLRGVVIDNAARTAKGSAPRSLTVQRVGDGKTSETVKVTGMIPIDDGLTKVYRSVGDHVRISGEYVKAFLRNEGVIVRGEVREGKKPNGASLLYVLEGYDVRRIAQGLNTFSNNYIADVLVKRMGAAFPKSGPADQPGQGSYENGIEVLRRFLRDEVKVSGAFTLENGSGLSTENRLTAQQVTQVLQFMEKSMTVFPDFIASLPASGWDGTLKRRFAKGESFDLRGQARAKTGTLTEPVSVAALAGYMRHPQHGLIAFCIIENGVEGAPQPPIADLRERQDQALVSFMHDI
jgi:D-alanyl-D-alanine carboxypeptidase/D-alanyl-D-alanine-endopeptidase (penicillin-binding protein 4)